MGGRVVCQGFFRFRVNLYNRAFGDFIVKLFYTMFFCENAKDILTDKLTMLVNCTISQAKTHLTLCIPQLYDAEKIKHYRETYDEITVHRFLPEKRYFWNTVHLLKYLHYCGCLDLDEQNIFISQGVIFPSLQHAIFNADICYCQIETLENISATNSSIMEFLNKLGYPIEVHNLDECYDFRCCYISPKYRKYLYIKLADILEKYQQADENNNGDVIRFIGQTEVNIILTLLVTQLKEDYPDLQIKCLDEKPLPIKVKMVEQFYSII